MLLLTTTILTVLALSEPADRRRRNLAILAMTVAYLYVLFAVIVGGDWMPRSRFLIPMVPLCVLWAVQVAESGIHSGFHRRLLVGAFAAALALTLVTNVTEYVRPWTPEAVVQPICARWQTDRIPFVDPIVADEVAHYCTGYILRYTVPGDRVLHLDLGQSGYFANDVVLLDQYGLVSRYECEYLHGWHSDEDMKRHFVEANPSVCFVNVKDDGPGGAITTVMQVARPVEPLLKAEYVPMGATRWWENSVMIVFVRKDAIDRVADLERLARWEAASPQLAFERGRLVR
jgi:hypothetical protein